MASAGWSHPPRLPLIEAFEGLCEAGPEPLRPEKAALKEYCNLGYARGRCARFPAHAPWDAVRFTAGASGEIRYILEKNYSPAETGPADAATGRLAAQAGAFGEAWKRRARKEVGW